MWGRGRSAHGTDARHARLRQFKPHAPSIVSEGLEFNEFRNGQIKCQKQQERDGNISDRYPTGVSLLC